MKITDFDMAVILWKNGKRAKLTFSPFSKVEDLQSKVHELFA